MNEYPAQNYQENLHELNKAYKDLSLLHLYYLYSRVTDKKIHMCG